MLVQVRTFLRGRAGASLEDIARHLGVTPAVASDLCAMWIAKGRVERVPAGAGCAGCDRCAARELAWYRWTGE